MQKSTCTAIPLLGAPYLGTHQQLGPEHPYVKEDKGNLGSLFHQMAEEAEQNGERAEAAALYSRAAVMYEPQYGKDDVDVVECRAKARELSQV